MIIPVKMYSAECDICGVLFEHGDYSCLSDESSVREDAEEGGWHFVNYEHAECYCENCHTWGDDDELILKTKP